MSAGGRFARLRVGEHEVAVAADAVLQALGVPAAPSSLPRRRGALAGVCDTPWGTVPLLDLAAWLDLGAAETPGTQALVLRAKGRALAVRVSSIHGVAVAAGVSRLHHDEDPDELFQCAVRWNAGGSAALLEVERLMALTRVWCDEAELSWGGVGRPGNAGSPQSRPHALVTAGGARWALPAQHVLEVGPARPLELALPPGGRARGICTWRGRKLPVLDLAALGGRHERPAQGALAAVVGCGATAAAVLIDEALQCAAIEVPPQAEMIQPLVGPDGGELLRVDVQQLLATVPEAQISHAHAGAGAGAGAGAVARADGRAAAGVRPYLLFEADSTYAAPVSSIVQVLALASESVEQLLGSADTTLPFRGRRLPLFALPPFGGRAPVGPPQVALVVAQPDGELAAVAVQRVTGWVQGDAVQPGRLRTDALGELRMITVTQGAARATYMVVELDQVACMMA